MPNIHDLSDMSEDMIYAETQTSSKIENGDFLITEQGVATMFGAWPVMIFKNFGQSNTEGFHEFEDKEATDAKMVEYRELRTTLNWHPTLSPSKIAHSLITQAMSFTGANDAYDLETSEVLKVFEDWKAKCKFDMGDAVMQALIALGFQITN